jgi:hypothetical protein
MCEKASIFVHVHLKSELNIDGNPIFLSKVHQISHTQDHAAFEAINEIAKSGTETIHNIAIKHAQKLIIRTNVSKDLEIGVQFCVLYSIPILYRQKRFFPFI